MMKTIIFFLFIGCIVNCNSFPHLLSLPKAYYPGSSYKFSDTYHDRVRGFSPMVQQPSSSAARAHPIHMSPDTFAATSAIMISSSIGFASEYFNITKDSGTIITLVLATILTNVGLFGITVPSTHFIYDICWSRFLPASLVLMLFSSSSGLKNEGREEPVTTNSDGERSLNTRDLVTAVGIPFIIGSFGSILGCLLSTLMLVSAGSTTNFFSRVAMSPVEASIAAGCLCASYIGGTVNFFAAARVISKQIERFSHGKLLGIKCEDLLSAMAAADLILMAVYFGVMTSLMTSKSMHRWFPSRNGKLGSEDNSTFSTKRNKVGTSSMMTSGFIMAVLAWTIVEISIILENIVSNFVPGMGCAFIALFGTATNGIITRLSNNQSTKVSKRASDLRCNMHKIAPPLSNFCFYLLFAAIGTSANLRTAISYGLPCIAFAAIALLIHVMTIFLGSIAFTKLASRSDWSKRILPPSTEEVFVASNAAIGGASTAAALAGKSKASNKSGLILAATFWGIMGYAFSTSIGVSVANYLLSAWRAY